MSLMDELSKLPPNGLGGTDKSFIDADTLQDQKGNRFRIQGVNAGEIEKVIGGKYKMGTEGGQVSTDVIRGLANEQGFTNLVPQTDENGEPVRDPFGRIVADLTNDKGESFKSKLLEAGTFDVNKYTTEQDIAARDIAEARRNQAKLDGSYTPNAFDQAAADIEQAEQADHTGTLSGSNRTALNEAERAQYKQQYIQQYGEEIGTQMFNSAFSQNVQIRNYDRDINNKSNNPFSDSWEQGWTGVGEAAFGLANLIGTETGLEGVAQWGEDGVSQTTS